jgi:hypothetical protein
VHTTTGQCIEISGVVHWHRGADVLAPASWRH